MLRLFGGRRLLCGTTVLATIATLSLTASAGASAATFAVNSPADVPLGPTVTCAGGGAPCTLRAAVQAADAAGGASTITLPAGTFVLSVGPPAGAAGSDPDDPATGDLDIDSGVTVTLTGAGAGTLIDANHIDRAFAVHTGAGLAISDLTIEAGSPATESVTGSLLQGGAIYTDGTLDTSAVNFTANSSIDGGAIFADADSRLTVNGGTFTANGDKYGGAIEDASDNPAYVQNASFSDQNAYQAGGDIYFTGDGALTVSGSSFSATTSLDGGAIYAHGAGELTVSSSQFTGDGSSDGGAIFSLNSTTLAQDDFTDDSAADTGFGGGALYLGGSSTTTQTLTLDQFAGDSTTGAGGAIYTTAGVLGMAQSSIVNDAAQTGGGLYLGGSSALLEDDTIAGNSAVSGGGVYLSGTAPLSLVNDTLDGNSASSGGGGVFGAADATTGSGDGIVNTVIADNAGGDCDHIFGSAVVTGYDLDSDASCFDGLSAPGLQLGVQPLLAAPANNGGPVVTMLELAGSPTIGTGSSAYCPAADARSIARNPGSCDLGAYQAVSAGLTASNAAPASAGVGQTFEISLSATNAGPGAASNVTVSDQLPAGTTLAGEQPSAGSCTVSGTPAKLTCDLGNVAAGSSANVNLFVSSSAVGSFSNTVALNDNQGSTQSATASTAIVPITTKQAITRAQVRQITTTAATLRARLDPDGITVSYFFEYGTTRQFGKMTRVSTTSLPGVRSARIIGLLSGRRYFFRLVATSGSKVTYESTYSFVTKAVHHRKPKKKKKKKTKRK